LTDAVDGRQQEVAGGRRAGSRYRPEYLQHAKQTGSLCCEPQGTGQPEVARRGGQRNWRGTVLDERGDLVGGTEIRLVDDAGLALDARAFDDVIVELVALLPGDERGHI
jgi:hypothetical protein